MISSLGLVAGEASGDLLAARMLAGLQAVAPVDSRGIAGNRLIEQGMQAWHHVDELSVRGYVEVIRHLPRLLKLRADLARKMIAWHPSVFVGVDAPDFNIALETKLRANGLKTVHFIGPSVWAWRYERIRKVKEAADHVLLVFPFEKAIYDKEGIPATYVGHPLADVVDVPYITPSQPQIVALLPGSRADEISAMGLTFLKTAAILLARHPQLCFILPAASDAIKSQLNGFLNSSPELKAQLEGRLNITDGQSHDALAKATTVLVASGTATLEAALFKRPMVIAYKMPWLSYRLMKDKGYKPYVGLPNILADDWLVPEFIQAAATPEALANALSDQLDNPALQRKLIDRFSEIHISLKRDCPTQAAQVLLDLAQRL
jgi:lipid-A-disaccharide synthase